MSLYSPNQRHQRLPWIGGFIFTTALHTTLIYFIVSGPSNASEVVNPMVFQEVELLRLGESINTDMPTISNPAPETQPEEVVHLNPQDPPEEEPEEEREEEPEVADLPPEQPRDNTRHNPERPVNQDAPEGREDGIQGGTSLSVTAQNMMIARIQQAIQRAYQRPAGITDEQMRDLEGEILVRFNHEGRITGFRWIENSQNPLWDRAVERTLNHYRIGSRRLPLPFDNTEAMSYFIDRGIQLTLRF